MKLGDAKYSLPSKKTNYMTCDTMSKVDRAKQQTYIVHSTPSDMIQESNEDMCGMGISKQSESAKKDRYVSAGAKPEKTRAKQKRSAWTTTREERR